MPSEALLPRGNVLQLTVFAEFIITVVLKGIILEY